MFKIKGQKSPANRLCWREISGVILAAFTIAMVFTTLGLRMNANMRDPGLSPSNPQMNVESPRPASVGDFLLKWGVNGTGDSDFNDPIGITINASGYVYVADGGNNRIEVFSPDNTFLFKWGAYGGNGSQGTGDGEFYGPLFIAINASGYVYVTDEGNNRVQVFTSTGQFLFKWGTQGSADGQFFLPCGIAVNSSGYVYVTDMLNYRVQVFTPTGQFLFKWGTQGSADGQFFIPMGITINDSGYVYVADEGNCRVQVFYPNGTIVNKWGTLGQGEGQFAYPTGIVFINTGIVCVEDTGNNRTEIFTQSGEFVATWGSTGSADGEFNFPYGIAVNATGQVYVTDSLNCRFQVFDSAPVIVGTGIMPNQLCGALAPSFSLSVAVLTQLDTTWYSLDGGTTNTTCALAGTLATQWGSHPNGTVTVTFWANDTYGKTCSRSVILQKDVIAPSITSTGIAQGQLYGGNPPSFSLAITGGGNLNATWYSLDGGATNTTCALAGTLGTQWGNQPNGTVTITFWVNDSLGNATHVDLTVQKDIDAPTITGTGLSPGQLFSNSPPVFSLSITEGNLNAMWYSLDGGTTNTTCNLVDTLATQWDNQPNGTITVTFWANDTLGNVGSYSISVQKDIAAPIITGTGFTSGQLFGASPPAFTMVIEEGNLNTTWYSLDGGATNTTCVLTDTLGTQWDGQPNGTITVTFWANDTLGNVGSYSISVQKDIIAPAITVTSPMSGGSFIDPPTISWSISGGGNLDEVWYTMGNDPTIYVVTGTSAVIDSTAWAALPAGEVTLHFHANDTLGNSSMADLVVVKAPVIGNNSWVLPTVIGVGIAACFLIVVTVVVVKRKHRSAQFYPL